MSQQSPKILYLLVEASGKTYWNRAGVAFLNNDGSFNVKLDMFPGLTFNLKDPKPTGESQLQDDPPRPRTRSENKPA